MNKKFKLPLLALSIPASTSAVVPFVSSCKSSDAVSISTDGSKQFIPKFKQAVGDTKKYPYGYTDEDATDLYFDAIEENPELFFDELRCGVGNFIFGCTNGLIEKQIKHVWLKGNFNLKYSNLSINKEKHTVSFHLHGSCDSLAFHLFELNGETEYVKMDSFDIDYQNIKLFSHYGYKVTEYIEHLFWSTLIPLSREDVPNDIKITIKASGYIFSLQKTFEYRNDTYTINANNYYSTVISNVSAPRLSYLGSLCKLFGNVWTSAYLQNIIPYSEETK